ncbi:MAG: hypothetical protein ACK4S4_02880 [Pyrinomonadaceae bacterium]
MTDKTAAAHEPNEDDVPTRPVDKPADGWTMPEPVFRQSSGGTLPRRLGVNVTGAKGPAGESGSAVEERRERPSAGRRTAAWLLLLIGIAIVAAAAAIVLLAVYLYLAYRAEGSGF